MNFQVGDHIVENNDPTQKGMIVTVGERYCEVLSDPIQGERIYGTYNILSDIISKVEEDDPTTLKKLTVRLKKFVRTHSDRQSFHSFLEGLDEE